MQERGKTSAEVARSFGLDMDLETSDSEDIDDLLIDSDSELSGTKALKKRPSAAMSLLSDISNLIGEQIDDQLEDSKYLKGGTMMDFVGDEDFEAMFAFQSEEGQGLKGVLNLLKKRMGEEEGVISGVPTALRLTILKRYLMQSPCVGWDEAVNKVALTLLIKAGNLVSQREREYSKRLSQHSPVPVFDDDEEKSFMLPTGMSLRRKLKPMAGGKNDAADSLRKGLSVRSSAVGDDVLLTAEDVVHILDTGSTLHFGSSKKPWFQLRSTAEVSQLCDALYDISMDFFVVAFEQQYPDQCALLATVLKKDAIEIGVADSRNLEHYLFAVIRDVTVQLVKSRSDYDMHPMVDIPRIMKPIAESDVLGLRQVSSDAELARMVATGPMHSPLEADRTEELVTPKMSARGEATVLRDKIEAKRSQGKAEGMSAQQKRDWCSGFRLTEIIGEGSGKQIINGLQLLMSSQAFARIGKELCCEGCGHHVHLSASSALREHYLYFSRSTMTSFVFHNWSCVQLRKLKESLRMFLVHTEIVLKILPTYVPPTRLAEDILVMLKMKDTVAMSTGQSLPKPAVPCIKMRRGLKRSKSSARVSRLSSAKLLSASTLSIGNLEEPSQKEFPGFVAEAEFQRERFVGAIHMHTQEEMALNPDNDDPILKQYQNMPKLLRTMDIFTFGPSLWAYCVLELQAKDRRALWACLVHLASLLPTPMCVALLEEHREQLSKFDMRSLDCLCQAIIESSQFPAAVALYLAAFMKNRSQNDLSRCGEFDNIMEKYIQIATDLLAQIESDHLLAIICEIPSEIDSMSIYDISLRYGLSSFLDFHRLSPVMLQMWYNVKFLDPSHPFPQTEMSVDNLLSKMLRDPAGFYYAPVGQYLTSTVLYMLYLFYLSYLSWKRVYLYQPIPFREYVLWVFNVGYVSFEVMQLYFERGQYLTEYSNWWDATVSINWIVMAAMRFGLKLAIFPRKWVEASNGIHARDKDMNIVYMVLWGFNLILLWTRVTVVMMRNKSMSAILVMISKMIGDIANFAVILVVMTAGFCLALHYLISDDIDDADNDCGRETNIGDLFSVVLFVFQTLLGQQEWATVDVVNTGCMQEKRARGATMLIIVYSILGSLLLLNLLIAIMATTYENVHETAAFEVNFSRIRHTVELSSSSCLMSPPLNVIVFAFVSIWNVADVCVQTVTAGGYTLYANALYPMQYSLKAHDSGKEKLLHKRRDEDNDNKSWMQLFAAHFSPENAKICRYCRHEMKSDSGGNIDDYFELFRAYQVLDEADKSLMRTLLRGRKVCEFCFRPFEDSQRLHRWQTTLEIMSYYVFLAFVSVPVLVFMAIPAAVNHLAAALAVGVSTESSSLASAATIAIDDVDAEYRETVRDLVKQNNRRFQDEGDGEPKDAALLPAAVELHGHRGFPDSVSSEEEHGVGQLEDIAEARSQGSHAETPKPLSDVHSDAQVSELMNILKQQSELLRDLSSQVSELKAATESQRQ